MVINRFVLAFMGNVTGIMRLLDEAPLDEVAKGFPNGRIAKARVSQRKYFPTSGSISRRYPNACGRDLRYPRFWSLTRSEASGIL